MEKRIVFIVTAEIIVDGWMYSSTVRDGGVRCKIDSTDSHHWDFIPIEFNNGESVLKYYSDTKDNPYGWTDICKHKSSNEKLLMIKGFLFRMVCCCFRYSCSTTI